MRSRTQIRPEFIFRLLIALGLLVNVVIFFLGLRPVEEEKPAVSVYVLERQAQSLRQVLNERALPTEQEAEKRAVGLFRLAEQFGVTVVSWSTRAVNESLGASGQVNMMRSTLEFRGERRRLVATLEAFRTLFGENMLVSDVELRGAQDNWILRLNLTQFLTLT